jgi:hypothetical protein
MTDIVSRNPASEITMRSAIVLVAVLATCACAQTATKDPSVETQATPAAAAPPANGPSAAAAAPPTGSSAAGTAAEDPSSPNWQVTSIKLSDNRWRLELRMRRWHTGGDGEAEVLLHDQARKLAEEQGYRHYVVLSFVQGIESTVPIAQRWARGEIELQEALPPMPLEKP